MIACKSVWHSGIFAKTYLCKQVDVWRNKKSRVFGISVVVAADVFGCLKFLHHAEPEQTELFARIVNRRKNQINTKLPVYFRSFIGTPFLHCSADNTAVTNVRSTVLIMYLL